MENPEPDPGPEWVNYVVFTVVGMALLVFASVLSGLFEAVLAGRYQVAESLASILSVLGTLVLVAVTWHYVSLTSELVSQTEKQRQQERELEISKHRMQQQNLRLAFLIELVEVEDTLSDLAESGEEGRLAPTKYLDVLLPTVIYESNADQIGLLTSDEAAALTSIYTRVLHIRSTLKTYDEIKQGSGLSREDQRRQEVIEMTVPVQVSEVREEISDLAEIMSEEIENTPTADGVLNDF